MSTEGPRSTGNNGGATDNSYPFSDVAKIIDEAVDLSDEEFETRIDEFRERLKAKNVNWNKATLRKAVRKRRREIRTEERKRQRQSEKVAAEQSTDPSARYRIAATGLVRIAGSEDEPCEIQVTNFIAKIITDVVKDDGLETTREFELEAQLPASRYAGSICRPAISRRCIGSPNNSVLARSFTCIDTHRSCASGNSDRFYRQNRTNRIHACRMAAHRQYRRLSPRGRRAGSAGGRQRYPRLGRRRHARAGSVPIARATSGPH